MSLEPPRSAASDASTAATAATPDGSGSRATTARFYDRHLGGGHAEEADIRAAEHIVEVMPELPAVLKANLAFLQRSVRHLAGLGIQGFLDLGAGIPTIDNVHEIVHPAATVYVDHDPLVVDERRILTNGTDRALSIRADLRDAHAVMTDPEVTRLLDPAGGRPIAVLMTSVLHFTTDDQQAADLLAAYRSHLPPGSHLVLSHAAPRPGPDQGLREAVERYSRLVAPMKLRSAPELAALLDGFHLLDPGIVPCTHWRPDPGFVPGPLSEALPQLALVARLD